MPYFQHVGLITCETDGIMDGNLGQGNAETVTAAS
jgi:hypothetical protein